MFPLTQRKIIRGCEAHIKAGLGCATDYVADYVELYAPFTGRADVWGGEGYQGGNWLNLVRPNGDIIQLAHLSKYKAGGEVQEGELIAITGNTGTITTGPHLHIQIKDKDGNRLDPEEYNWDMEKKPVVTKQILQLLYELGFKRQFDHKAKGYIGKPIEDVLKLLIRSEENAYYTRVFKEVKVLENWARLKLK